MQRSRVVRMMNDMFSDQEFLAAVDAGKSKDNSAHYHMTIIPSHGSFHYLMKELCHFDAMEELKILCGNIANLMDIPGAIETITSVLSSNPQLKSISFQHTMMTDDDGNFDELLKVIQRHPNISTIALCARSFGSLECERKFLEMVSARERMDKLFYSPRHRADMSILPYFLSTNRNCHSLIINDISSLSMPLIVKAMKENVNSKISSLTIGSLTGSENQCGDDVVTLFNAFLHRLGPHFFLNINAVEFGQIKDVEYLLDMVERNIGILFENSNIQKIGRHVLVRDASSKSDPVIIAYKREFKGIYERNKNVLLARKKNVANAHDHTVDILSDFVYLHYQEALEKEFNRKVKNAYPVSLQSLSYATLFRAKSDRLSLFDGSHLHDNFEFVRNNKKEFELQ